jgi:hypothetical protein
VAVNPGWDDAYVTIGSGTVSVVDLVTTVPCGTPPAPTAIGGNRQAIVSVTRFLTGADATSYHVAAHDSTTPGGRRTCTVAGATTGSRWHWR